MSAYEVKIEWDEDGCYVVAKMDARPTWAHDGATMRFRVDDPEQLYDAVKGGISPWLYEKEQAYREFRARVAPGGFACEDPEDSWIRDVALGAMGVGESLEAAAAALDSIDLSRKQEKGE